MKSFFFSIFLCVCAVTINAQPFNRTYYLPGYDLVPKSVALLDQSGSRDFVVGSIAHDVINPSNPPKYLLSKMDASGTPLNAVLRNDAGYERIIETFDDHIVTATEYFDKIVVRKYDNNLALLFSVKIDKAVTTAIGHQFETGSIDIEAIHFPGASHPNEENYFIYFTEGYPTLINPNLPNNTCVSVVRLDQDLGFMWHNTYPEIRTTWESWQILEDVAYSMTKFPNPDNTNEHLLALAGTRNFMNPGQKFTTFYMTIDLNGNVVAPYTEVTNSIQDVAPDILFDGDSLVATFQPTNSMDMNTDLSVMFSIMKFDVGLSSFRTRFYWNIDNIISVENYSSSISHGNTDSIWYEGEEVIYGIGTDNNYVLGGQTFPTGHQPTAFMNPILMSVDRVSLDPMLFRRFNTDRGANAGVRGMFHRNDPSYRQYLPVEPAQSTGMRMIVTNPFLNACGSEVYEVEFRDTLPGVEQHDHEANIGHGYDQNPLNETGVTISYDDCINSATRSTYKQSTSIEKASNVSNQIHAQVFPTLITNKSIESVQCQINSPMSGNVKITILNLLGQQLHNKEYMISAGENMLQIDVSYLTTGMNIIRISHENKLISNTKVQVLN